MPKLVEDLLWSMSLPRHQHPPFRTSSIRSFNWTRLRGSGHSYDNALAESVIGPYKAELVRRQGPWRGLDDLELPTLEWVDWFNHRRLKRHVAREVFAILRTLVQWDLALAA